ncbi:MAG: hypothetical protein FJ118_07710 [Deltaproteobacteria bacterium]|nr:hypothetical protein [Deltaproteobacteria bacterium]
MLRIPFNDILRATMSSHCGNLGWIGVSPRGDQYHVVVPVDAQIARGVMACNRPTDGTPFGGYTGWLYFMCPPYECQEADSDHETDLRHGRAYETCRELVRWLASYGIQAEVSPGPPIEAG